jgi:hypothetical protein
VVTRTADDERRRDTDMAASPQPEQTDGEARRTALEGLIRDGLTFAEAVLAFHREQDADVLAYIEKAKHHAYVDEGVLEVDDVAVVSVSSEGGAYVQAWLYIGEPE